MELAVDYVEFLREQKHYEKGVEVGEQIYDVLNADKSRAKQLYAAIVLLLVTLYADTNRYQKMERKYEEALVIYRGLSEECRRAYLGDVVDSCNNLGISFRVAITLARYSRDKSI